MKLLLACAAGMSTSLLVNGMRKIAAEGDVVEAVAYSELDGDVDGYDVVLLGSQIRFRLKEISQKSRRPRRASRRH